MLENLPKKAKKAGVTTENKWKNVA